MEKAIGEMPMTFGEVAVALAKLGWRPIPLVADTKQPAEPGWPRFNKEPWEPAELAQAVIFHHDAACGIALPTHILALDLDIVDPDAVVEVEAAADEYLGPTPLIRIGQEPKSVRIYRAVEGVRSTKPHPIELYCGSGQVAVFGWHAKAGRPYLWPESSPLEIAADSDAITLVTAADLNAFFRVVEPILRRLRRAKREGGAGIGRDAGEHLRELLTRGLSFRAAAARVLEGADDGGRHYAVRAVISAGYNRGYGRDQLEAIIRRNASAELLDLVESDGYLERTLDEFAPYRRPQSFDWDASKKQGGINNDARD